jgi:chemotaxis-related protein WspD
VTPASDCWNQIGVWGDGSCPELANVVHCHNCPVFASAGRRFLEASTPDGYAEEWAQRLAAPVEQAATDLETVLVFRLGEEWLALPTEVLVEVAEPRPIHRIPHRAGLLAGLVNIRGELHLCARLAQLLGIRTDDTGQGAAGSGTAARLVVAERDGERWVFPVEEVDQVRRLSTAGLTATPATLTRASARMTRGVFSSGERAVGCLDAARLFQALRTRLR